MDSLAVIIADIIQTLEDQLVLCQQTGQHSRAEDIKRSIKLLRSNINDQRNT